jgi:hypothetical protein
MEKRILLHGAQCLVTMDDALIEREDAGYGLGSSVV